MKNKMLLLEDFHSVIPEFLLDDAVEKCANRWKASLRKTQYSSLSDSLCEELRGLLKRYIFMNPTWKSAAQKSQVTVFAVNILDDTKGKVAEILEMPGRTREEIRDFIRDLVLQQIDTFLRNSSTVTRP
jgi:hypothetical protein